LVETVRRCSFVEMSRQFAAGGLASIVVLTVAGCGGGARPLAWPKSAGVSVAGEPVKPGEFGLTAIPLDPRLVKHPLVLLGVRPEYPQDARGLRVRYAAKVVRDAYIGGAKGWRPRSRGLHPRPGSWSSPGSERRS
jgi:hypothetical protein